MYSGVSGGVGTVLMISAAVFTLSVEAVGVVKNLDEKVSGLLCFRSNLGANS